MLRDIIIKIQSKFVSADEVAAFLPLLPRKVDIQYKIDGDQYIAFIDAVDDKKIEGLLITEGKSVHELANNLNQLVYMNAKIPEKIRPYYGNAFPFSLLETNAKTGELTLARA